MYNRGMYELRVCSDKDIWDDFVLDNDGHPLQLWGWGQVKSLHGWSVERVLVYNENDKAVGGAQILFKKLPYPMRKFAYIPRGPVLSGVDMGAVLEEIKNYVKKEHKAVALSVEPEISREIKNLFGWTRSANKILPAETIILDLQKTESDMLADMAKKTRQYIRKSSADVVIKTARTREDVEACLDIYRETARRAGFNLHSEQYYLDVFLQLKDHSPIFMAYVDDKPVAFLWLAISADVSYELYGGMNEVGQQTRANYALKWYAIRKTKEWGLTRYDFGGLISGGVSTFKKGWSTEVTTLVGTYDYPLSPMYVMWSKGLPFAKKINRAIRK